MVDMNWLLDKKAFYEEKQKELEGKDYEPVIADLVMAEREVKEREIEEYLEKYKEELTQKYLTEAKDDIQRVKHYLELLDEEIIYLQEEEKEPVENEQECPEDYVSNCEEHEEVPTEYYSEPCAECQIQ